MVSAQIPSLLLAIATAIIVTRVSTSQDLSKQIGSQIGVKQAWCKCMRLIPFWV